MRRVAGRQELWGGNRERITYRRRRREYPLLLAARPDLVVVRLRSAAAADP